ncbi:uncharacterized protein LOC131940548 [Physella acuta]|uniref:uncharacterized protein LOC131940548 n=1 Tax=Physella acuta TaxID=109671 RepID=UPI0027DC980A|nr:uncharacterized protein LOC131940548 [Physella acuta]XP_059155200.1 uncharacterized protein LOC131940548 [Physella acuta]XP_059155201.1 uncharacterized protein LOC131940548 [Physella acuta]XP_059155203.1 uncharacterized protein LOC131940548 [Physella acuta]XP_059155204.1 uncharacterized protein LOC131940548 [Physella acuta]
MKMSKVPRAHEIFHNPALGKTSVFQYNEQESMQKLKLNSKKSATPVSGMKKFGGYKPKILGGQSDFLALQQDTERTNESSVVSRDTSPTKPRPWVVGDKNVPMVLGTLEDDDDYVDENGNNPEMYLNGFGRVNDLRDTDDVKDIDDVKDLDDHARSETSTLVSQHSDDLRHGLANAAYVSSSVSDIGSTDHLPAGDLPADDRPEPSGVFIPAPDYDEEERTLDFNSEDTDEGEDHQRANPQRTKPVMKVYDGEDLSRYLSDDDDEVDSEVQLRHNGKSHKGTVNPKHTLFKQSQSKSKKTRGGTQGHGSVRSFSYADSKFGTKGKASSKSLVADAPDDSQRFLTANTHQSSYESFLRSRNGDVLPSTELNDSGVDMGEEFGQHKDGTLWKKMTVRLKNRLSKSLKDH